tara:strand:+ start:557 stop:1927 length:1371 start_codon:yes stop_codon:yes gene_type:complete
MSASESNKQTIQAFVYDIPSASKLTDIAPEGDPLNFPEVISFNYYENVLDPFIQADITILDSSGVIDKAFGNCGIRQFCPVEIIVNDPSNEKEWERERSVFEFSGTNCFYINRVKDQITQGKKKQYTLELVTRDGLVALSRTIKSAWPPDDSKGIDYNTVVSDVLNKYIQTSKDYSYVMDAMSESVDKVMGNGRKPIELINNICTRATPKGTATGGGVEETRPTGYAFYETYDSYKFDSIYKLLTEPSNLNVNHGAYTVNFVNDNETSEKNASYSILGYKFYDGTTQTSLLEEITAKTRGKAKTLVLDHERSSYKTIEKLTPETVVSPCLKSASDNDFAPVKTVTQSEYQIEYYNTCEPDALDNRPPNPELSSMNYGALLDTLKSRTSTIKINGNLSLSAGNHIYIDFPEIQGDGINQTELSAKYSGYYLITKIKHYTQDIQHVYTIAEICKLVTS